MTTDSPQDGGHVDRVNVSLFYDHGARDDARLSDVTDIAQSNQGARLLDRLDHRADALYLGAETTFERVELGAESGRHPTRPLDWEFWNGQGWASLDVDVDGVAEDGRGAVFRWTAPPDWRLSDQGGDTSAFEPQYWVRARLADIADPIWFRRVAGVPLIALGGAGLAAVIVVVLALGALTGSEDGPSPAPVTTPNAAVRATATATPARSPGSVALDISGRWDITVVNTITTGACDGEQGSSSLHQALFEQSGSALVVTGFGGSPANQWDGMVVGTTITFNGTRPEDGGTTTASFTLEVNIDAGTLEGAEAWTWDGSDGSCPGSASTVTGFKVE